VAYEAQVHHEVLVLVCPLLSHSLSLPLEANLILVTIYGVCSLARQDPAKGFVASSHLGESKSIFFNISVKMMFRLLPPSMRILGRKALPTMGLTTSGYVYPVVFPGEGKGEL
jgi:hypothetical protein